MENNIYHSLYGYQQGSLSSTRLFSLAKDNLSFVQKFKLEKKLKVHNGCVNTVCWNDSGQLLLSGSDDRHLIITDPYAEKVKHKVLSGHHANMFSAKFLPNTAEKRIVSCSGDGLITFTDLDNSETSSGFNYNSFDCHFGTVYEVVTVPGDSNSFLSCGEDGTVRWFDLRVKDRCVKHDCTEDVLINCRRAVTSLAVNPLLPWQLSVGCSDGSVVMYDRRKLATKATGGTGSSRNVQGMMSRFSAPSVDGRNLRITSLTYSHDAEEVLVSYSTDHVYLFNIKEDGKAKKLSSNAEGCGEEGEEGTRPPVKRLRLRGDWSDTGPNALPERERGTAQIGNTAQSIMQRMSDMLTRWLDDAASQLEATDQTNENEGEPEDQGQLASGQRQSDVESEHVNRSELNAVRELNFGEINVEGTSVTSADQNTNQETHADTQVVNKSEQASKENTGSAPDSLSKAEKPSTSYQYEEEDESNIVKREPESVLIHPESGCQSVDLNGQHTASACNESDTKDNFKHDQVAPGNNQLKTLSETTECDLISAKSNQSSHKTYSDSELDSSTLLTESKKKEDLSVSPNVNIKTESPVKDTSPPCKTHTSVSGNSENSLSSQSEHSSSTSSQPCARGETDLKDLHRMVHKLQSHALEPTVSLSYSSQGASTSQIKFHFPPKPSTSNSTNPRPDSGNQCTTNQNFDSGNQIISNQISQPDPEQGISNQAPKVDAAPTTSRHVGSSPENQTTALTLTKTVSESITAEAKGQRINENVDEKSAQDFTEQCGKSNDNTDEFANYSGRVQTGVKSEVDDCDSSTSGALEKSGPSAETRSTNVASVDESCSNNSSDSEADAGVRRPRLIVGRGVVQSSDSSDSDSDLDSPPVARTGAGGSARSSAMRAIEQNLAARRLQRVFRRRQELSAQQEEEDMDLPKPAVKQTYRGHRNARTMIKQANFWGQHYVLSGSDCGHVFVWDRQSARLVMLFEADAHVVNCVQPHPFDPILATSGIDYDIKLWSPFSHHCAFDSERAEQIMERNKVMLEETRDTLTVPASFMLRMLASINRVRAARRGERESNSDSEQDD